MLKTSLIIAFVPFMFALLLNIDRVYKKIKYFLRNGGLVSVAWGLMFLATGLWVTRTGAVTGVGSLDPSAVIQISFVTLASCILLFLVIKGEKLQSYGRIQVFSFFMYGMFAVLTIGISAAPALTAYKSGLLLADSLLVVVAISVLQRNGERTTMLELTYAMSILFIIFIAAGGIMYTDLASRKIGGIIGYNLNSIFPILNANDVGYFAAISVALGIRRAWEPGAFRPRLFWMTLAIIGFVVLFFAQARTSIVGLAVVLIVYAFSIKRMRIAAILMVLAISVLGAFYILNNKNVGFEEISLDYLKRGQSDEMVTSMSGRAGLWSQGFDMLADSPLIGHGYEAGVKYGGRRYGIAEGLHMHNAHMQVLVNSGILGYLSWIIFLASVAVIIIKRVSHNFPADTSIARYEVEMFAILMLTLMRTMTGSVLVFHHCSLLLLLGMLVYMKVQPLTRRDQSSNAIKSIAAKRKTRIIQERGRAHK